jgi:ornithine--oxo-acid transaminase
VRDIRGRGLLIGVELDAAVSAARVAEHLLARGIATRDTNGNVIRLAPPLIIDETELDYAFGLLRDVLGEHIRTAVAMH